MDEQLQKWLDGKLSQDEWERYKNSSAMKDELEEMENFMLHLQDMDPEQVKRVLANQSIQT